MDDLFYQISKSKTKSVKISGIPASKSIKEKLELGTDQEEVIQIKRLRFLEDKPFAYTLNYLPVKTGGKIRKKDLLKKPLLQIIEEDLHIHFTEAFPTIEASFANSEVSEQLGVLPGSPILFVERIMYTQRRKPVEVVQSSYRGDLYKYIVRLRNFRRKRRNTWIHESG